MSQKTLETILKARRNDPRALRGAITFNSGKPCLTFGVVGDHNRFSVEVSGNKLKVVDDPRPKKESKDEGQGKSEDNKAKTTNTKPKDEETEKGQGKSSGSK